MRVMRSGGVAAGLVADRVTSSVIGRVTGRVAGCMAGLAVAVVVMSGCASPEPTSSTPASGAVGAGATPGVTGAGGAEPNAATVGPGAVGSATPQANATVTFSAPAAVPATPGAAASNATGAAGTTGGTQPTPVNATSAGAAGASGGGSRVAELSPAEAAGGDKPLPRAEGAGWRPPWWFDGVKKDGALLQATGWGESATGDLAAARKLALDAGYALLAEQGGDPNASTVVRYALKPAADGDGLSYFVLVRCPAP